MLHLAVFDITGLSYTDLRPFLPVAEQERLDSKRDAAYRVASAAGRLLSRTLYRHVYNEDAPSIVLSDLGAPSFLGDKIGLSISHADSLVGVAMADEHTSVGVDIESAQPTDREREERRERMRERLRLPTVTQHAPLPHYLRASFSDGRITLAPVEKSASDLSHAPSFIRDFTTLEAVIKAEGKGFSALGDFAQIFPEYNIYIGTDSDTSGAEFVITVASKCKQL